MQPAKSMLSRSIFVRWNITGCSISPAISQAFSAMTWVGEAAFTHKRAASAARMPELLSWTKIPEPGQSIRLTL